LPYPPFNCKELPVSEPAISRPAGYPQPDRDTVLTVLQEQLDDLLATRQDQQAAIDAQQAAIDALAARVTELEQRPGPPAGGP
jgi:hypothetical protein